MPLVSDLNNPESGESSVPALTWEEPTLTNAEKGKGEPLVCAVDAFGIVHLAGTVKVKAKVKSSTAIVTLPSACRPTSGTRHIYTPLALNQYLVNTSGALYRETETTAYEDSFDGVTFALAH